MAPSVAASFRRARTRLTLIGCVALAAVIAAVAWRPGAPRLGVQLLDVAGYTDDVRVWMPFRVTLGLTNRGRDRLVVRRVVVEPDFETFNEAYGMAVDEIRPGLALEPGASASFQAGVTLLNATQLQPGTRRLTLRVRVEADEGEAVTVEFPATFRHDQDARRRVLTVLDK